jgi:hypothetical protein
MLEALISLSLEEVALQAGFKILMAIVCYLLTTRKGFRPAAKPRLIHLLNDNNKTLITF